MKVVSVSLALLAGVALAGCSSGGSAGSVLTSRATTTTIGPPPFSGYDLDRPVGQRYSGTGPDKVRIPVTHADIEFGVWCLGEGGISVTVDGKGGPFPTPCSRYSMHTAVARGTIGQYFSVDIIVESPTRWVMQAFIASG